jgi:hypothetical protein
MVMITLVLAVLVLLVAIPMPYTLSDASVPSIFKILKIRHDDGSGHLNFESYMVLKNTGNTNYDNWNLFVLTYVGGEQIPAEIPTLNANEQAADHVHHLVQTLGGLGASGSRKKGNAIWPPGALLSIDYKDGTFHPGDMVTIEVYNKTTRQIISRDMYKA